MSTSAVARVRVVNDLKHQCNLVRSSLAVEVRHCFPHRACTEVWGKQCTRLSVFDNTGSVDAYFFDEWADVAAAAKRGSRLTLAGGIFATANSLRETSDDHKLRLIICNAAALGRHDEPETQAAIAMLNDSLSAGLGEESSAGSRSASAGLRSSKRHAAPAGAAANLHLIRVRIELPLPATRPSKYARTASGGTSAAARAAGGECIEVDSDSLSTWLAAGERQDSKGGLTEPAADSAAAAPPPSKRRARPMQSSEGDAVMPATSRPRTETSAAVDEPAAATATAVAIESRSSRIRAGLLSRVGSLTSSGAQQQEKECAGRDGVISSSSSAIPPLAVIEAIEAVPPSSSSSSSTAVPAAHGVAATASSVAAYSASSLASADGGLGHAVISALVPTSTLNAGDSSNGSSSPSLLSMCPTAMTRVGAPPRRRFVASVPLVARSAQTAYQRPQATEQSYAAAPTYQLPPATTLHPAATKLSTRADATDAATGVGSSLVTAPLVQRTALASVLKRSSPEPEGSRGGLATEGSRDASGSPASNASLTSGSRNSSRTSTGSSGGDSTASATALSVPLRKKSVVFALPECTSSSASSSSSTVNNAASDSLVCEQHQHQEQRSAHTHEAIATATALVSITAPLSKAARHSLTASSSAYTPTAIHYDLDDDSADAGAGGRMSGMTRGLGGPHSAPAAGQYSMHAVGTQSFGSAASAYRHATIARGESSSLPPPRRQDEPPSSLIEAESTTCASIQPVERAPASSSSLSSASFSPIPSASPGAQPSAAASAAATAIESSSARALYSRAPTVRASSSTYSTSTSSSSSSSTASSSAAPFLPVPSVPGFKSVSDCIEFAAASVSVQQRGSGSDAFVHSTIGLVTDMFPQTGRNKPVTKLFIIDEHSVASAVRKKTANTSSDWRQCDLFSLASSDTAAEVMLFRDQLPDRSDPPLARHVGDLIVLRNMRLNFFNSTTQLVNSRKHTEVCLLSRHKPAPSSSSSSSSGVTAGTEETAPAAPSSGAPAISVYYALSPNRPQSALRSLPPALLDRARTLWEWLDACTCSTPLYDPTYTRPIELVQSLTMGYASDVVACIVGTRTVISYDGKPVKWLLLWDGTGSRIGMESPPFTAPYMLRNGEAQSSAASMELRVGLPTAYLEPAIDTPGTWVRVRNARVTCVGMPGMVAAAMEVAVPEGALLVIPRTVRYDIESRINEYQRGGGGGDLGAYDGGSAGFRSSSSSAGAGFSSTSVALSTYPISSSASSGFSSTSVTLAAYPVASSSTGLGSTSNAYSNGSGMLSASTLSRGGAAAATGAISNSYAPAASAATSTAAAAAATATSLSAAPATTQYVPAGRPILQFSERSSLVVTRVLPPLEAALPKRTTIAAILEWQQLQAKSTGGASNGGSGGVGFSPALFRLRAVVIDVWATDTFLTGTVTDASSASSGEPSLCSLMLDDLTGRMQVILSGSDADAFFSPCAPSRLPRDAVLLKLQEMNSWMDACVQAYIPQRASGGSSSTCTSASAGGDVDGKRASLAPVVQYKLFGTALKV